MPSRRCYLLLCEFRTRPGRQQDGYDEVSRTRQEQQKRNGQQSQSLPAELRVLSPGLPVTPCLRFECLGLSWLLPVKLLKLLSIAQLHEPISHASIMHETIKTELYDNFPPALPVLTFFLCCAIGGARTTSAQVDHIESSTQIDHIESLWTPTCALCTSIPPHRLI